MAWSRIWASPMMLTCCGVSSSGSSVSDCYGDFFATKSFLRSGDRGQMHLAATFCVHEDSYGEAVVFVEFANAANHFTVPSIKENEKKS